VTYSEVNTPALIRTRGITDEALLGSKGVFREVRGIVTISCCSRNTGATYAPAERLGITILEQSQASFLVPGQDTLAGECPSCAFGQWVTGDRTRSVAPYVTEEIDDDVVAIREPDLEGLVVIPRQHISGINGLSVLGRANLLAALRRVAQSVQERNPGSATRILVMTDAPATEDHVCFHVTPCGLRIR